jgi:hypothetical protein
MAKISSKICQIFQIFIENFMKLNSQLKIDELFEKKHDSQQISLYGCYLDSLNFIDCILFFIKIICGKNKNLIIINP